MYSALGGEGWLKSKFSKWACLFPLQTSVTDSKRKPQVDAQGAYYTGSLKSCS